MVGCFLYVVTLFRFDVFPERLLQKHILDQGDKLVSWKLFFAKLVFSKLVIHGTNPKFIAFQWNYLTAMFWNWWIWPFMPGREDFIEENITELRSEDKF